MPIEDDIKSIENDIVIIENFQNGGEWNAYTQAKAAEVMTETESKIDSLMLDNLNKEQVAVVVKLLARFTKCQDTDNPRRVLPN